MYDVVGRSEMAVIVRILWSRLGVEKAWGKHDHDGGYTYTSFCSKATGPDDPNHRARTLDLSGIGGPVDYGCSCGATTLHQNVRDRMGLSSLRDNANPRVWPVVNIDVNGQSIPHFAICRDAMAPFDPRHAPPPQHYLERCICGSFFMNHLCTLEEYTAGIHRACTGGPNGCEIVVGDDPDEPRFQGKLFPLY